ncbi:MAG: amidohydrolase family protein [Chloroflexi bacterium]|nr:amidohydrolase family protein [Chloroflexota bacterium]
MTNDPGDRFTLITADRLIDGDGAPPIERGAVLIKGDAIVAVGPRDPVVPPEGAPVDAHDYPHATVLPGLIDSHVHLIGIGDGRKGDDLVTLPDEILTVQAAENARLHLHSGVTTVRDCGAKNRTTFLLRQAMDMGIATGPRLLLSGRPMAIVGGHLSYFGIEATGVDQCRAAVRQLIKEGADFIKITATGGSTATSHPNLPSFNVDELTAIIEEAHKFGKHAAAHCASSQGMVNALDAGIDTIIHAYFKEPDGSFLYRPELADRIAEQGVFVNPTMHQGRNRLWRLEEKARTDGLTPQEQADLDDGNRLQEIRYDQVARMVDAGVRLTAGSDAAWSFLPMGTFQDEVQAHTEAGLSPLQAVVSATGDAAKSCWVDDSLGTLQPGKLADLLVVHGDPSDDIAALSNVLDVFKDGARIDRGDLV